MKDKEARERLDRLEGKKILSDLDVRIIVGCVIRESVQQQVDAILDNLGLVREWEPAKEKPAKWIIRKRTKADKKKVVSNPMPSQPPSGNSLQGLYAAITATRMGQCQSLWWL